MAPRPGNWQWGREKVMEAVPLSFARFPRSDRRRSDRHCPPGVCTGLASGLPSGDSNLLFGRVLHVGRRNNGKMREEAARPANVRGPLSPVDLLFLVPVPVPGFSTLSLSLSRRPCGWSATRWRRASWTIDHRDAIVHACTYESRISLRLQCVRFNAYSIRGNGSNNAVDRGSWYIGSSDRSRWLTP